MMGSKVTDLERNRGALGREIDWGNNVGLSRYQVENCRHSYEEIMKHLKGNKSKMIFSRQDLEGREV